MRRSSLSYIGLGGNLGDVRASFAAALATMGRWPDSVLEAVSGVYCSPPMGPSEQPDYLNAVAALRTTRSPMALLSALQSLEREAGRVSGGQRWGPRELDLDLLLYDSLQIDEEQLKVPHPGLHLRAFVIHPLAEIAPQAVVPGRGSVASIAARTDASSLRLLP